VSKGKNAKTQREEKTQRGFVLRDFAFFLGAFALKVILSIPLRLFDFGTLCGVLDTPRGG
jgi:hypothetical protein